MKAAQRAAKLQRAPLVRLRVEASTEQKLLSIVRRVSGELPKRLEALLEATDVLMVAMLHITRAAPAESAARHRMNRSPDIAGGGGGGGANGNGNGGGFGGGGSINHPEDEKEEARHEREEIEGDPMKQVAKLGDIVVDQLLPAILGVSDVDFASVAEAVDMRKVFAPADIRASQLAEELSLLQGLGVAIQLHGSLKTASPDGVAAKGASPTKKR